MWPLSCHSELTKHFQWLITKKIYLSEKVIKINSLIDNTKDVQQYKENLPSHKSTMILKKTNSKIKRIY